MKKQIFPPQHVEEETPHLPPTSSSCQITPSLLTQPWPLSIGSSRIPRGCRRTMRCSVRGFM